MNKKFLISIIFATITISFSIAQNFATDIIVGAERTKAYLPLLKGKRVGIVANQTSLIKNVHLVDSLISLNVDIKKIFSPEHGFRGNADAGEYVSNNKDEKTGLQIVSLYGNNKKPATKYLNDIDIIIFDIQDVGVRFYTYISTMHYMMEVCAENNIEFLVLDRPNPNGFYIDGPILENKYKSFVGLHPVPIVHGMTIAEYARMINAEYWLKDSLTCKLSYIVCKNYSHKKFYKLPVKPSPNLPNMTSIYLYPTFGLFEGTKISIGRGTDFPFQVIGHPNMKNTDFKFIPQSIEGAKNPKLKGKICYGYNFREVNITELQKNKRILLELIEKSYFDIENKKDFFNSFFNKLAGNKKLEMQITNQVKEKIIRKSWKSDIAEFKKTRKKYLLYEDF